MSGLPAQPSIPQYEDNMHLRSYSTSDQSMDLDALFDHFTAIDGTDQSGLNPQFMQNLGFAPNANLADLMASDYGWALDPG
jgi:aminopeptidase-like protein